jgi:transcriptional regulator with XRE-family HTH domain
MTPKELREWRQALELTQEQAARGLDVTLRAYTKWESGETPITKRVDLATRMYLRLHRTTWGNRGLPLVYVARVYGDEADTKPRDHHLVFARNEHEASKIIYEELGSPRKLTVNVEAVADAPAGATPRALGSIADIARRQEARRPETRGQKRSRRTPTRPD